MAMEVAKKEAIRNFHRPEGYSRLPGYYRSFTPGFSTATAPLSDLIKKEMPKNVKWTEELEESFSTLKVMIAREPILTCPDSNRPFFLQTDTSERGLGAVLSQEGEDGEQRPVQPFTFTVIHRPGAKHGNADGMS